MTIGMLRSRRQPEALGHSCSPASVEGIPVLRLRSAAGVEAIFAPAAAMACCSLRVAGVEVLSHRHGLRACAGDGMSLGLALTHPWANRLSAWSYTALGRQVRLPVSPLLRTDRSGLPFNGIQPGGMWTVQDIGADHRSAWIEAALGFDADP